ncbi:MAG: ABC transporter ATP-binding protein [Planctomycetales bacterium]|nr:ABC transporter ATP-binding protein [Planctomycetales bacterium]
MRITNDIIYQCWLGDTRRRLVGQLSKGYRQRVGLADALVADPPILILDEPTVGLDPNQIREVRSLVKELGKDHTILLSTHILRDVEAVASRVMIIHRGKIARDASLADLSEAAARSGRVLVEATEDPDVVAAGLRDVPGVAAVERDGGGRALVVKSEDGRDVRPDVYREFVKRGWTLVDLRRESETLEDIFYRSTIGADETAAAEAAKAAAAGDPSPSSGQSGDAASDPSGSSEEKP